MTHSATASSANVYGRSSACAGPNSAASPPKVVWCISSMPPCSASMHSRSLPQYWPDGKTCTATRPPAAASTLSLNAIAPT